MNFNATGGTMQSTASQTGNTSFTLGTGTCTSTYATISQSGATFTVTAVKAGPTCTFVIDGAGGMSATLSVNITSTGGTISTKPRLPNPTTITPIVAPNPRAGAAPHANTAPR